MLIFIFRKSLVRWKSSLSCHNTWNNRWFRRRHSISRYISVQMDFILSYHVKYLENIFFLDEFHPEFRRRNFSTFSPTNITNLKKNNEPMHENNFISLPTESEPRVLDYCIAQKRPQLFTRSIDRRAILRNHQMLGYSRDVKLPKRLRHNESNSYSPNGEMFDRSFDGIQYNTSSSPSCEATLSRSYLASRSRGYQAGQPFSMQLALEQSPNHPSVFRNKRSREETWLV